MNSLENDPETHLGELGGRTPPSTWRLVSLGEVCERRIGSRDPGLTPDTCFRYIDISSVDNTTKQITNAKQLLGRDAPSRARQIVRRGDVIISMTRPNLNAVAMVPPDLENGVCSTGFSVLRTGHDLDPRFLFYFVRTRAFVDSLSHLVSGQLYPAVTDGQVKAQLIPLPGLDVQQRVVTTLDEATELQRLRREADQRTAALVPAIFDEMFGDPATNPKGWPVAAMRHLLWVPPNYGTMVPPNSDQGDWLDLRVVNIQNGSLTLTDRKYVNLAPDVIPRYSLCDGDLLLARAIGSQQQLGKCVVVYPGDERWAFDSHLMRVRFDERRALPEFIRAFLTSAGGRRLFLDNTRQSAVQFNINAKEFGAIDLPLPPVSLQQILVKCVSEIRRFEVSQAQSKEQLAALSGSLLERAFRGEI